MIYKYLLVSSVAVTLVLGSTTALSAAGLKLPFEGIPRTELTFGFDDSQAEWDAHAGGEEEVRFTWQGHTLIVRLEGREKQRLVRFRLEPPAGKKLTLQNYSVKVTLPLTGLHTVTVPNTPPIAHTLTYFHEHKKWPDVRIHRCLVPQGFSQPGNSNCDAPFILLTDNKGNNAVAAGWTTADRASNMKGEAQGDNYVLTISRQDDVPFTGDAIEDCLFLNTNPESWWNVVRAYAKTFDDLNKRRHSELPEWATDPVFCTWYCYGDHIDQAGVLKIAHKCKEMGFGTILVDAGWDCRTDGGYADFENGILGDFVAMPDRFPDLPGTIKQIHDMGLRVELWSAPFWQGRKSKAYQEKTGQWHVRTSEGENYSLCPRYPGTRDYLKERFAWVARTYGVDGMWLDAADSVPPQCSATHEHLPQPMGAAFVDCLAAVHDGLRSVNPQAVTEARVCHANINTKRALDVVQPSDAPESFEVLRMAGIHIRAWAYDVVFKNDPMFWKKNTNTATVGKFLATLVCNGVPALSVDFLKAPEEQCKQTAAWLAFYKKHKATLLHGDFRLFGADYTAPDMMLVGEKEAVVYIHNTATREVILPKPVPTVILLNCTDADNLKLSITPSGMQQRVQSYGPDWTENGQPAVLTIDGHDPKTYAVPQGAAAIVDIRVER